MVGHCPNRSRILPAVILQYILHRLVLLVSWQPALCLWGRVCRIRKKAEISVIERLVAYGNRWRQDHQLLVCHIVSRHRSIISRIAISASPASRGDISLGAPQPWRRRDHHPQARCHRPRHRPHRRRGALVAGSSEEHEAASDLNNRSDHRDRASRRRQLRVWQPRRQARALSQPVRRGWTRRPPKACPLRPRV